MVEESKRIAEQGLSFGIIARSNLFPPRDVLNSFFHCGHDDLPGERILAWKPFTLDRAEYGELLVWWTQTHPLVKVDRLSVPQGDFREWFARAVAFKP